jgi:glutamyl-tRNA reductase
MTLVALGINHKTASLDVREKVAFSAEQLPLALQELIKLSTLHEAALLSTCNRMELYMHVQEADLTAVFDWIKNHKALSDQDLDGCHYLYLGEEAVKHLMKVASGLDSMVLGEPQILGQLKQAYSIARSSGTTGTHLERLFQQTFSVAKKVRTETEIGASAVSVAYAAVTLAKRLFSNLEETTALFIGAGETIELAAKHFTDQQTANTIFANRTRERAIELAEQFNGEAISLSDIVISSTASPLPILGKGLVENAIKQRKRKPIFMIDLAVPRDIEAEVRDLDDVYLYDVDALKNVVDKNIKVRERAAEQAITIIDKQAKEFMQWRRSLDTADTIKVFRDKYHQLAEQELQRSLSRLEQGENPEQLMTELTRRLTNKFLHEPTQKLNQASREGDKDSVHRVKNLFSLEQIAKRKKDN